MNNQSIKYQGIVPRVVRPYFPKFNFRFSNPGMYLRGLGSGVRSFGPTLDVAATTLFGAPAGSVTNAIDFYTGNQFSPRDIQGMSPGAGLTPTYNFSTLRGPDGLPVDRFARPTSVGGFTPPFTTGITRGPDGLPLDRFARPNLQSAFTPTTGRRVIGYKMAYPPIPIYGDSPGVTPIGMQKPFRFGQFINPNSQNQILLGRGAGLGAGFGMLPTVSRGQQFIDASAYMEGPPSAAATTSSAATTPSTTATTSAATTPSGGQEIVTTSTTPVDSTSIEEGISNVDAAATAADSTKAGLETTLGQDLTPPPFITTEQANTESGLNIPARAYDLFMEGDYAGAAALAAGYQYATRPIPKSLTDINLKNTKQGNILMRPDQYINANTATGFGQFTTQRQNPLLSERVFPIFGRATARGRAYNILPIDKSRLEPYASSTAATIQEGPGRFSRILPGGKKREENFNKLLSEEQSIPYTTQKSVLENVSLVDDQASANYGNVGGRLSLINDNIQVPISVNRDNVTVVALDNNSNPIVAVQNVGGDGKPILFAKTDKGFLPLESDLNLTSPKPATRLSGKKAHRDDFFIGEGSTGIAFTPAEGSNLAKLGKVLDDKKFNYEVYVQNKKTVPTINITSGGDLGSVKQLPPMEGSFPGLGVYNLGTPEIPRPMPNFIGPAGPYGSVYPQNIVEGLRRFNPPVDRFRNPGIESAFDPNTMTVIIDPRTGKNILDPVDRFKNPNIDPPSPPQEPVFRDPNIDPPSPPQQPVFRDPGIADTKPYDPNRTVIMDRQSGLDYLNPPTIGGRPLTVIPNRNLIRGVIETTEGYFIKNPRTGSYEPYKGQNYYKKLNGGTMMFNPFMR